MTGSSFRPKTAFLCAVVVLMWGGSGAASAQSQGSVLAGLYLETNYSKQPGIQVSYSSPAILRGRPRFGAAYSTSRLAVAIGSNALVEDRLQVSAGWYFRQGRPIRPFTGLALGYTRFDVEDREIFGELDNSAVFGSLLVGLEAQVHPAVSIQGHAGLSGPQFSTVYPFVAAIGVHYHLTSRTRP
jgi:hypothetical protein